MTKNKIQKNKGFTLIEMMVAVSLFVIVALIVSGVLIQLSAAYKKAQAMRLLMDNLNFALEKMNLEIREGTKIYSIDNDNAVEYYELGDTGTKYCYSLSQLGEDNRQTLAKCTTDCPCSETSSDVKDMLSPEISLEHLNFKISSVDAGGGLNRQAKVLISVKGQATVRANQTTEFMIQTSASQRTPDSAN